MNREYLCGRDFFLLHIDIKKTLALEERHRHVDGDTYLTEMYNKYVKTLAGAQVMTGDHLIHNFPSQHYRDAEMV